MKPNILATAERVPLGRVAEPRVLRFAPREAAPQLACASSVTMTVMALLVLALAPMLAGRTVAMALDDALLGGIAGMLTLIPLMIALCPRQRAGTLLRPGR